MKGTIRDEEEEVKAARTPSSEGGQVHTAPEAQHKDIYRPLDNPHQIIAPIKTWLPAEQDRLAG